ncbi:MAG: DUF262 domain-containing protein [Alphaproteobacteria bacterium]
MQTNSLTLQILFEKDVQYVVPLFQRPYVWEREAQWEPLWDDIVRVADRLLARELPRAHFLGASVQDKPDAPPGVLETWTLIDGQQRLTTLQILLQAFCDAVAGLELEPYRQALIKMTRNDHPLATKAHEAFKVWPTNADRLDFRTTMEAGSPNGVRRAIDKSLTVESVGRLIPDAYLFFHDKALEWLGDGEAAAARADTLYRALRQHVRIVVIDLDEKDDAQVIFETLNARGTPLLAADLIKNALLQGVITDGIDPEDAYEQHWRHIDDDPGYWRKEVGRGHAKRPRVDTFLQHYLILTSRNEVAAAHLYTEFIELDTKGAKADPPVPPAKRMAEISRFAKLYRRLDTREASPRARLFLERLATMDIGATYPFLLRLFDRFGAAENVVNAVLGDLESFLVRRMVCRLSTRGYGRVFLDLLETLEGDAAGAPGRLSQALIAHTAEVDRWPDDEEFGAAWRDYSIYENLTRPRVRLTLEALERAMRGPLAETEDVPKYLTVEHIMPQAWETHWPLSGLDVPAVEANARRKLIHTIGNLTLLNDKLNPLVSNGPWTSSDGGNAKRNGIKENSVLFLNKAICEREVWDDKTIRARSEELLALAKGIWPRQPTGAGTPSRSTIDHE